MSEVISTRGANVFTVPPGLPFLKVLARAILNGDLPCAGSKKPGPLELPAITLILPTRRAVRAIEDAFLDAGGGRAMLLPAMRPISEGEEDLGAMLAAAGGMSAAEFEVPPAIDTLERRLMLTQLVMRWREARAKASGTDAAYLSDEALAKGGNTPAQAAQLAAELARLMDMVETENVSLGGLKELVPDTYSAHWQDTLEFLKIVTEAWPAILAADRKLNPADRRNRLILAEAKRLTEHPPEGPVIVAGVTGSVPATAELMRAVLSLERGAIVLPALDLDLDQESWDAIAPEHSTEHSGHPRHPEHPQYGLKKLLAALQLSRADVRGLAEPEKQRAARTAFFSEAMRPAETTARWHSYVAAADKAALKTALSGVSLIEAPNAEDEAEAVALILREAAETPGRTAALVSPDRLLARRVANRLESWGIRVDDSAGRPFAKTVPGTFLNLVIDATASGFAPAATMALLKHPLARFGLDPFPVRRAARGLEIAAFRTTYLDAGIDGILAALERAKRDALARKRRERALHRLWGEDWAAAEDLVLRMKAAFAPLIAVFDARKPQTLQTLAAAHFAAAEATARWPEATDGPKGGDPEARPLLEGEAGSEAANLFHQLMDANLPAPDLSAPDYPEFYRSLIATINVRPRIPVHPRLSIWGPFEARLQHADVIVLGSLNDGTWPESADPGPWLNRPMRNALGLPSPEEEIGRSAHDFTSLLGAERVYLTRALKMDGVPAVASRWLLRIGALLKGLGLDDALRPDRPWLGYARARDAIDTTKRVTIKAPEPRPVFDVRPRAMSVTEVETWIANPYAIYARKILGLEKLPELGKAPGNDVKGALIHEALARFQRTYPRELPRDPKGELLRITGDILSEVSSHPRIRAFWLPRIERFAAWFAETEPERRTGVTGIVSEVKGAMVLDAPGGPFRLTARADRIDAADDGLVVTDYKTGAAPGDSSVVSGMAPQLPLEAAIALAGGFEQVPVKAVKALRYIRASGAEPPGEERDVKIKAAKKGDETGGANLVEGLAQETVANLTALVARFDDAQTPYKAVRRARFQYDYDDFALLARVAEWAGGEEASE